MGFLDKLWDETLAGPTPESGLGKLRKYNSFSGSRSSPHPVMMRPVDDHRLSITIVRGLRNGHATPDSGSIASSPAASNTPTSPLSPTAPDHSGNSNKLTRRKSKEDPKTGYDWIVLSGLDR